MFFQGSGKGKELIQGLDQCNFTPCLVEWKRCETTAGKASEGKPSAAREKRVPGEETTGKISRAYLEGSFVQLK
jgi:hypothetical protein